MLEFTKRDPLLYCGFEQLQRRGTIEVLEDAPEGCFVRESLGGTFSLAAADTSLAIEWLRRHHPESMRLLQLFDPAVVEWMRAEHGFDVLITCRQALWRGDARSLQQSGDDLSFAPARPEDFSFIRSHYEKMTDAELRDAILRGDLFTAVREGKTVGFIGYHPEGSMGLLYILPEERGRGYGAALERRLIRETLRRGWIPFCQVETKNAVSLRLQARLGLTLSEAPVYWVFRDV